MKTSCIQHHFNFFLFFIDGNYNKSRCHNDVTLQNQHTILICLGLLWVSLLANLINLTWYIVLIAFSLFLNDALDEPVKQHGNHEYENVNIVHYNKFCRLSFMKINAAKPNTCCLIKHSFQFSQLIVLVVRRELLHSLCAVG